MLSGRQRIQLIVGKRRGVGQSLLDVCPLEVGQIGQYLLNRHAVGHEVHHVTYRDTQTANSGFARQDVGIVRDAIESVSHSGSVSRETVDSRQLSVSILSLQFSLQSTIPNGRLIIPQVARR